MSWPARIAALSKGGWSPRRLGTNLLSWFDAEALGSLSLSGGSAGSWSDLVSGNTLTQAVSAQKPVWGATLLAGRPGLTFDGSDDNLSSSSIWLPTGSAGVEIWSLASQDAAAATTGTRRIFAYGGSTNNDSRFISRTTSGTKNAFAASVGTGAAATSNGTDAITPAFDGVHAVRAIISPTTVTPSIDGNAASGVGAVPATAASGTTKVGVSTNGAGFFAGVINSIIVTNLLDAASAAQLLAYLKKRGSLS